MNELKVGVVFRRLCAGLLFRCWSWMSFSQNAAAAAVSVSSVPDLTLYYDDFLTLAGRMMPERLERRELLRALSDQEGSFESYEAFVGQVLRQEQVDCRVYTVSGHRIDIVVPEDYAVALQEVRSLRLHYAQLVRDSASDEEIEKAWKLLLAHRYAMRVLPEDLVPVLDQLPNTAYIPHIVLSGEPNPIDVWIRSTTNPMFRSAASTNEEAQTILYRHERNIWLKVNLYHEWCHRLEHNHRLEASIFFKALEIELYLKNWVPRSYAYISWVEHLAVIGEELLDDSSKKFLDTALNAPLRSYIWMKTCEKALLDGLLYRPSVSGVIYLERVQYANLVLRPMAFDVLTKIEAKLMTDTEISEEKKALHLERLEAVRAYFVSQMR